MRSSSNTKALARKHLDRRLASLRGADDLTRPPRGWIRAIRDAIGMTTTQLAERTGVSQSRIPRIEDAEARDSITLKTLRSVAEAMDCTLVYALVPNRPLDELLRERAQSIADKQLSRTNHTMKLENQALEPRELKAERERLVNDLISGDPRRLWDTP
jgi:predicted DNA-binding mobile mystery protein A